VSGAGLSFKGGRGFPDLVLFGNYKDLFDKKTDANGEATLAVVGKMQKRQIPYSAKPASKEFSVIVSAQPEAVTGNSIANVFLGGLSFPSPAGGLSSFIDVLKTVHWELGEYVFRLTDWNQCKPIVYNDYELSGAVTILAHSDNWPCGLAPAVFCKQTFE